MVILQILNLMLELLSTFDLVTDVVVLYTLVNSEHTAWLCLNLTTILLPYFISYVQFVSYQLEKIKQDNQKLNRRCSCLKSSIQFFATTPLLIVYLFFIDLLFLIITAIMSPIMIFILVISCGYIRLNSFEYCIDGIY